ncbi:hypothetical protein CYMTET_48240 [Cymbomonas tetramitiformis]|uniref:Uncharacterized protein n=1 Tax=Cymbomonas tetramitiformis TaxID=36881 RepID=A0AAE0EVY0_9CHLO|nr:hypothetical protein CYMTET_48240 [Cymbomonas tetramitiformis]
MCQKMLHSDRLKAATRRSSSREALLNSVERERSAARRDGDSQAPSEADTEDSQQQEGHYGMSPVRNLNSAALTNSALMLPTQESAHPSHGLTAVDAGSHPGMSVAATAAALVPAQTASQPAAYVAPAVRNPATRVPLSSSLNDPSRPMNTPPVNPQPVTSSLLPQPQPLGAAAPAPSQPPPPQPVALRVLSPQHLQPGEAAGIPSFAALMDAKVPSMGLEELVSGSVDGLTVDDLASPSAMRREMRENYSGNVVSKADKSVMRRVMQFLQVLTHATPPCPGPAEWHAILVSGCGVFSSAYEAHLVHQRTALIIKARYEFLGELVEYAALEWPWCSWEGVYVFLTAKYVSVWEMTPFSKAVKLDRDLLRFHSEDSVGDHREAIRQYISDTAQPSQLTDILAKVNMVTAARVPVPSAPRAGGGAVVTPSGGGSLQGGGSSSTTHCCPLCGGAHQYRVDHCDHPRDAPITVVCGKEKLINGVKKRCVLMHAFSGPLRTPCEHTEDVA